MAIKIHTWMSLRLLLLLPMIFGGVPAAEEKPVVGTEKLGEVIFELSCASLAIPAFNQAAALLHSFEYDEARRTFVKVTEQAPQCAMAHWGVAMTYLQPLWAPPTTQGFREASQAILRAKNIGGVTPKENNFIDALGQYFDGQISREHRSVMAPASCHGSPIGSTPHREKIMVYRQSMAEMYQKYPDDIEVALFYALTLIATADPQDASFSQQLRAGSIMQPFTVTNPNHPGLAHYIIHGYDTPELAAKALGAARRYAQIAPDSAHARHMPSHIFQRLGMWDDSISSNIASTNSARKFAERAGIQGHWDEELHSLDFLANAYMQTGEYEKARAVRDYVYSMDEFYPQNFKVAYVLSATPARYALDRKDWQTAATLPLKHESFPWQQFPWERGITYFARGYGKARLGDVDGALSDIKQLKAFKNQLSSSGNDQLARRVSIQISKIQAWLALSRNNREYALASMQQAADMEWNTVIPTGAILPGYEMLGEMYLELKQHEQALGAFEKSLSRETKRRNSIKGIIYSAKALSDSNKVSRYTDLLRKISKDSPAESPVAVNR